MLLFPANSSLLIGYFILIMDIKLDIDGEANGETANEEIPSTKFI
jgi:hypothetical protein